MPTFPSYFTVILLCPFPVLKPISESELFLATISISLPLPELLNCKMFVVPSVKVKVDPPSYLICAEEPPYDFK